MGQVGAEKNGLKIGRVLELQLRLNDRRDSLKVRQPKNVRFRAKSGPPLTSRSCPFSAIVAFMLKAIDRELPLEASTVRREVELGRALANKEVEEEIREFQANAQPKAAEGSTLASVLAGKLDGPIGMDIASPQ